MRRVGKNVVCPHRATVPVPSQLKVCLSASASSKRAAAAAGYDTISDTNYPMLMKKGDIMRPVNCVKGERSARCAFSRTTRSSKSMLWLCGAKQDSMFALPCRIAIHESVPR
jgi:hypothetical protein